jgi:hypothetical protein
MRLRRHCDQTLTDKYLVTLFMIRFEKKLLPSSLTQKVFFLYKQLFNFQPSFLLDLFERMRTLRILKYGPNT